MFVSDDDNQNDNVETTTKTTILQPHRWQHQLHLAASSKMAVDDNTRARAVTAIPVVVLLLAALTVAIVAAT